jgi:hypothetical protein
MHKVSLAGILVGLACIASSARSATVQYRLELSEATGQFDLFASASPDDNAGIASYSVALTGAITALDHVTPYTSFALNVAAEEGAAGFSLLRSANGLNDVYASQNTISVTPHLLYGLGQTASSFSQSGVEPVAAAKSPSWGAELKIATGFYDPVAGSLGIDYASNRTLANVFRSSASAATMAADIVFDPRFAAAAPLPTLSPAVPGPLPPPVVSPPRPASAVESLVEYRLEFGQTPGEFKLFGSVKGAGAGLAAYGVELTGSITSLNHASPTASFAQSAALESGSAGFTLFRSADGSASVHGAQDTITATPHLLYGLGQEAGSLAAAGLSSSGPVEGESWGADLLLATGTFDETLGAIAIDYSSPNTVANVFTALGSAATMPASVSYDSRYAFVPPAPAMPEPQPPVALPEPPLSPPTAPVLLPPLANDPPALPELPAELPNSDMPDVIVEDVVPPTCEVVIGAEIKTFPIWTYDPPRWDGALVTIDYLQRPFFLVAADGTTLSQGMSRFETLAADGTIRSLSLRDSLLSVASTHVATEKQIPEPATFGIASMSILVLAAFRHRK